MRLLFSCSLLTLCDPMDCSTPGSPVLHCISRSLFNLMSIKSVMLSYHLILCCSLLLPPSVFSRVRVSSNDWALPIREPKYWSFSFSMSLSNEYSGLISFRMDGFISLHSNKEVGSSTWAMLNSGCLQSCVPSKHGKDVVQQWRAGLRPEVGWGHALHVPGGKVRYPGQMQRLERGAMRTWGSSPITASIFSAK